MSNVALVDRTSLRSFCLKEFMPFGALCRVMCSWTRGKKNIRVYSGYSNLFQLVSTKPRTEPQSHKAALGLPALHSRATKLQTSTVHLLVSTVADRSNCSNGLLCELLPREASPFVQHEVG